jgi:hypothetical protein
MTDQSQWDWFYAASEEGPYTGQFDSRDTAISEAQSDYGADGFWIGEAKNPPVRLADWIGADRILELAGESLWDNDRISSEFDDGDVFVCTKEQETDLITRMKAACDEWQAAHGLIFRTYTFEQMRNVEFIEAKEGSDT